jgi:septum formation protein
MGFNNTMNTNEIILASSSPRRKELLSKTVYRFKVITPSAEERRDKDENINEYLIRNVKDKAYLVKKNLSKETNMNNIFISADTVVTFKDLLFEKPIDRQDAFQMLSQLSGNTHEVITTYGCFLGRKEIIQSIKSTVKFSRLSRDHINWYLDKNEFMDKSGAYSAQGYAACFIEKIVGSYTNILGLPLSQLCRTLEEIKDL